MDSKTFAVNPLRRILIPLDGSTFSAQALPYARAISAPETACVFLQVVPKAVPIYGLFGERLLSEEQVEHAYEEEARKGLECARETLNQSSANVDIVVCCGDYADEILAVANERRADLVVMATHGRGGLDRWIIGSVADRVARMSTIPVMLIHPRDDSPPLPSDRSINRLIVPLDGSERAAQALPFAGRIAAQLNISVLVVTVSDLPHELAVVSAYGATFSQKLHDELLAEGRSDAEKMLKRSATVLRGMGVSVSEQVLEGPVAKAIVGAAGEDDLIVMTSHGHGGIRRLLLGSVANQLINQGNRPVVLVPVHEHDRQDAVERNA